MSEYSTQLHRAAIKEVFQQVKGLLPKASPLHVLDIDSFIPTWGNVWKGEYPDSILTGSQVVRTTKNRNYNALYIGGLRTLELRQAQHVIMGTCFPSLLDETIEFSDANLVERGLLILEMGYGVVNTAALETIQESNHWSFILLSPKTASIFFIRIKGEKSLYFKGQYLTYNNKKKVVVKRARQ